MARHRQHTNCSNRVQILALAVQLHQCIFDINDDGDTALPESRLLIPKAILILLTYKKVLVNSYIIFPLFKPITPNLYIVQLLAISETYQ